MGETTDLSRGVVVGMTVQRFGGGYGERPYCHRQGASLTFANPPSDLSIIVDSKPSQFVEM